MMTATIARTTTHQRDASALSMRGTKWLMASLLYGVTATAQYKIWKGLMGRLEYRHDQANRKVFAATGDKGAIYKITSSGKGSRFYKTNATNVVAGSISNGGATRVRDWRHHGGLELLLDIAEALTGLALDPAAQPDLQRAVLGFEILDGPELTIDTCEAQIGDLVQLAKRPQDRNSDFVGRYFGLTQGS